MKGRDDLSDFSRCSLLFIRSEGSVFSCFDEMVLGVFIDVVVILSVAVLTCVCVRRNESTRSDVSLWNFRPLDCGITGLPAGMYHPEPFIRQNLSSV